MDKCSHTSYAAKVLECKYCTAIFASSIMATNMTGTQAAEFASVVMLSQMSTSVPSDQSDVGRHCITFLFMLLVCWLHVMCAKITVADIKAHGSVQNSVLYHGIGLWRSSPDLQEQKKLTFSHNLSAQSKHNGFVPETSQR